MRVDSQFLYGAPASDLGGDGEDDHHGGHKSLSAISRLSVRAGGRLFSETKVSLTVPNTNAAGITTVTDNTGALAETTPPLKAAVRISLHEPGGRTTDRSLDIPIRTVTR